MNISKNEGENQRIFYVLLFCGVLTLSLIITILIYYFIRHKKKTFFDAAGRKLIEFSGDYPDACIKLKEIIENDDIVKLEQEVVSMKLLY